MKRLPYYNTRNTSGPPDMGRAPFCQNLKNPLASALGQSVRRRRTGDGDSRRRGQAIF